MPHGTTATLAKLGAKTYTQTEGSKLRKEPKGGTKTGLTVPFQQCRGRFSRSYSPASQCPCRHQRWTPLAPPERHSSLIDLTGTASNYLTGIKGLACPYGSPKCQEEKLNSRQECGKLLQWQGFPKARRSAPAGTSTICRQLKPYHSVNSGSNLKTLCGIAVWAT